MAEEQKTGMSAEEQKQAVEESAMQSSLYLDIQVISPDNQQIDIPSTTATETLSFVKQSLLEFIETSHFTNYSFAINQVDSKELVSLNEFMEIGTVALQNEDGAPESAMVLQMVPDVYDVKKARLHVKRTRELIASPPLMRGSAFIAKQQEEKKSKSLTASKASRPANEDNIWNLPSSDDIFAPAKLGEFFPATLFRTGSADATQLNIKSDTKQPSQCITSITLSGWNPPPPARRLQGDLLYVEAVTADEGIFHITAAPAGFFINKCTRHTFDPTPAAHPHISHELLNTILGVSAGLRAAWATISTGIDAASARAVKQATAAPSLLELTRPNALDGVVTLFAQGKGDKISQRPQWNVPPASATRQALATVAGATPVDPAIVDDKPPAHTCDVSRAQDDLCDAFGADDRAAPREWNEEIQSVRAIVAENVYSKILKAKYAQRVHTEFFEACQRGAVAVVDGLIAPLNPMDPTSSHVFVYNSIFFSRAIDTKETFKLSHGDEAARKSAGHDLNSQRVIQSLEVSGLSTVMSCIVDYKGERVVGQTIIPGVLMTGAGAARLMFGAIEFGKRIACKKEALAIMETVGRHLFLPTRNLQAVPIAAAAVVAGAEKKDISDLLIGDGETAASIRTDDEDETVAMDSASVPHVGPVEGKLLKGADGRIYGLEMMRLTPRDANYVRAEVGGTELLDAETLSKTDAALGIAYILRHELVSNFIQRKVNTQRQAILLEAAATAAAKGKEESEAGEGKEKADGEEFSAHAADLAQRLQAITNESLGFQISPNCFLEVTECAEEGEDATDAAADPVAVTLLRSDVDEAIASADEAVARELATFLSGTVLPGLTHDVRVNNLLPADNAAMVQLLHSQGVNMRYLGRLATLASEQEAEDVTMASQNKQRVHLMPPYWLEMLEVEMIARGVKHVVNRLLRSDVKVQAAPATTIVSVLNHLFGTAAPANTEVVSVKAVAASTETGSKSKGKKNKSKGKSAPAPASVVDTVALITESLQAVGLAVDAAGDQQAFWTNLTATIESRFLHTLTLGGASFAAAEGDESEAGCFLSLRLSRLTLLRRVCQVCGLRIASREYNMSSSTPFHSGDLLALVPLAKSSSGLGTTQELSPLAEVKEMLAVSRRKLHEGAVIESFEVAQEASSWVQQVTGPLHKDVVATLDQMTSVLVTAGDLSQALNTASRSLALSVQLDGLDCQDVLHQHNRIASIYLGLQTMEAGGEVGGATPFTETGAGFGRAAIQHLLTCKYLVELIGGPRHPELVNILYKLGTVYMDAGQYTIGLTCIVEAKGRVSDLAQQAVIAQTLAEMLVRMGHLQPGLAEQKQAHKLMADIFGDLDEKTVEAKSRIERYFRAATERNVQIGREIQAVKAEEMFRLANSKAQSSVNAARNRASQEIVKEAGAAVSGEAVVGAGATGGGGSKKSHSKNKKTTKK